MFNILIHKGNSIKTTVRFHLTPVRIAVLKKTMNGGEDAGEKPSSYTVGGNIN
jgi:hypothetical protein